MFRSSRLTAEQEATFLATIGFGSIPEVCEALLARELSLGNVVSAAAQAGITGATLADFV